MMNLDGLGNYTLTTLFISHIVISPLVSLNFWVGQMLEIGKKIG